MRKHALAAITLTLASACGVHHHPRLEADASAGFDERKILAASKTLPSTRPRARSSAPPVTRSRAPEPSASSPNSCKASWYGGQHAGRFTASGEIFDPSELTTAHRSFAFGTLLEVSYAGRRVRVRVTDRGPAAWTGRCLDLSEAAFARLAPLSRGVIVVEYRIVR